MLAAGAMRSVITMVDWGNPFARNLQRLVMADAGPVDRIRNELPTRDNGCTFADTSEGRALAFDGTNNGLAFTEVAPTTGYTIWARVYSTASGTADRNIFSFGSGSVYSVQLRRETANRMTAYHFAAGLDQAAVDNGFSDGAFVDYCMTWDGANIQLYRDGTLVAATPSGTVTTLRTTDTLRIGEDNFGAKQGWLGRMSLFAYWKNRTFAPSEITEFYTNRSQLTLSPELEEWTAYATQGGGVALVGQACL